MSMEYDDGSIEHYFNKQPDKSYYQKYLKLLTNKPMLEEFRQQLSNKNPFLPINKNDRMIKLQLVSSPLVKSSHLQFDYSDLERNFRIFGKIESIFIKQNQTAFILYEEQISALLAIKCLNQFQFNSDIYVDIKLCIIHPTNKNQKEDFYLYNENDFIYKKQEQNNKYDIITKFIVDIHEPLFNTYRRILGIQCCNLRRILHYSYKQIENIVNKGNQNYGDIDIKVQQEKNSNINLYLFAMNDNKYLMAEKLTHELLANIYEEYKRFCENHHIDYQTHCKLQKITKYNNPCKLTFL